MKTYNESLHKKYEFRTIKPEEAEEAVRIEQICFPPHEACQRKHMLERISVAPEVFLVAADKETGNIAGFLNGIATDEAAFRDEFFTEAALHDPNGSSVMILGLDVLPEYRMQGLGRELINVYSQIEKERGRKRLVLTCHDRLVGMYEKFGFRDLGESASVWGGETWHEMEMGL